MLLANLNLKTWADWRVFITYVILPAVTTLLVSRNYDSVRVEAVIALVGYLLTLTTAAFRSTNLLRTWIYGGSGLILTVLLAYGFVTQADIDSYMPIVGILFGVVPGALAASNTVTTVDTTRETA